MKKNKFHEVITSNHISKFYRFDKDLICFDREHFYQKPQVEFNSFKFWAIGFGHFKSNVLGAKRKNELIPIEGLGGLLMPPSSIVEWHINAGHFKWCGYFPFVDYPEAFPKEASCFDWNGKLPKSIDEIFELVLSVDQFTNISKEEKSSAVAYNVRDYISKDCNAELSIKEVADHFGYSHAVMTRQFKKCFGITPIQFRNTLRVFDAMMNMIKENTSVLDAAYSSGFSDLSSFYRKFKRHINAAPCQFRQISK